MRKLGLMIIALAIALPLALVAVTASATSIPSAASGVYLGSDRVCRVELARWQVSWINLDLTCLGFDGTPTYAHVTLFAPGSCWNEATVPLDGHSPNDSEQISIRNYDPQDTGSIQILRGPGAEQVMNGIGVGESWARIATIASPAPYTCGNSPPASQPPQVWRDERVCRRTGRLCGG